LNLANATDGSGRVDETRCQDTRGLHLVTHVGAITTERPPLLSEVVDLIGAEPCPTLLEPDLKDWQPWSWPRVGRSCACCNPSRTDRITFGGVADWNLRRLLP